MSGVRSLSWRLIIAVIAATAAVVALAAVATWLASARARGLTFDQEVRDRARELRPELEVLAWRHLQDPRLPSEMLPADPGLVVVLRGGDGRELARSAGPPADPAWVVPGPDGVLSDAELSGIGTVRWMSLSLGTKPPPGERRRDGRPPRQDEGGERAQLILIRPTTTLRAELAGQAWLLAGMSVAVCLLTAVVVAMLINRLLRPLRRLGDGIAGMVPGSGAVLAVPGLPGELLPVQERLNGLLARVDEVMERERQTTANIAHELRTPLAGLRAKLELALLREREPEQIAALCRQGLATMTLLQGLVDNLLLLARLEAGQAALTREAIEVAEVAASAWSLHQAAAEERGLRLERTIEPALAITTDAGKLRAIVSNLLSNAVAYADRGSAITLAATEEPRGIRIVLCNDGAAIAPADAERVFEPFWRGDAVRTVESGHCGLGLPLVRRLAIILGGTITVSVDGRCFCATLVLPEVA